MPSAVSPSVTSTRSGDREGDEKKSSGSAIDEVVRDLAATFNVSRSCSRVHRSRIKSELMEIGCL
jgi:hypothetical protein